MLVGFTCSQAPRNRQLRTRDQPRRCATHPTAEVGSGSRVTFDRRRGPPQVNLWIDPLRAGSGAFLGAPAPSYGGGSRVRFARTASRFPGPTRYGGTCIGSAEYQPLAQYGILNKHVAGQVPLGSRPLSVPFPASWATLGCPSAVVRPCCVAVVRPVFVGCVVALSDPLA
jgi:hypothetical protein